jgi:hypothetical protein
MKIIHIGLGKTATTSLQSVIYPLLLRKGYVDDYNNHIIMEKLYRMVDGSNSDSDRRVLREYFRKEGKNRLYSYESLSDWNPDFWEKSCILNEEIFGSDSTIIITIRDPESYLRSVYQQMVHQGVVVEPQRFLLDKKKYNRIRRYLRPGNRLEAFNVDLFDLDRLFGMYKDRFSSVFIVPLQHIGDLDFIKYIFSVSKGDMTALRKEMLHENSIYNKSYSSLAMKMTMKREFILNKIGLKSVSSNDNYPVKILLDMESKSNINKYLPLNVKGRISRFIHFFWSKILLLFNWRYLMQNFINKYFHYEEYQLPKDVYLGRHLKKNLKVYSSIMKSKRGFEIYEK